MMSNPKLKLVSNSVSDADLGIENVKLELLRSPFFRGFSAKDIDLLAETANMKELSSGTLLFKEGESSPEAFLITEGQVWLFSNQGSSCIQVHRHLKAGSVIGKSSFLGGTENVSAKTIQNVKALTWSSIQLSQLINQRRHLKAQFTVRSSMPRNSRSLIQLLKQSALFHNVSSVLLRWLLDSATLLPMDEGAVLFKEGGICSELYLILKGTVKIFRESNRDILFTLNPGDCFGETALLESTSWPANAIVERNAEILIINKEDFEFICQASASFRRAIVSLAETRNIAFEQIKNESEILHLSNSTPIPTIILAKELASALNRQYGVKVLLIHYTKLGTEKSSRSNQLAPGVSIIRLPPNEIEPLSKQRASYTERHDYLLTLCDRELEADLLHKIHHEVGNIIVFSDDPSASFPFEDLVTGITHYAFISSKEQRKRTGSRRRITRFLDDDIKSLSFVKTIERLSRLVTRRSVGVALGGGGAWGFAHIALLRGLAELRIPVDMISGCSCGSIVGAYYAVLGEEGLCLLEKRGWEFSVTAPLTLFSSYFVERFVSRDLGNIDLEKMNPPFFPVATNLFDGSERIFREGNIARAVRASGSLPGVFGPTWIDGVKYVDGGVINNIPANVLRDEGADFIIGSSIIPPPRELPKAKEKVGVLQGLMREVSPFGRAGDAVRSFYILMQSAGEHQMTSCDFSFSPDLEKYLPNSFHKASEIVAVAKSQFDSVKEDLLKRYHELCLGPNDKSEP